MKYLKKYWPLFFLLAITVVYSFPFLFQGKIPFPSSYVANNLAPWNKYLPHGPVKNGIPDVPGEIYPMRSLVIDFWQKGIVPLWNPYVFSGSPLLANFQSSVLSPFNLLFAVFSKVDAWSIIILLQPILAAIFVYLLAKSLKLSSLALLFSSVSFMFFGYLTVWGSYATMGVTLLFLPLALFLTEKYFTGWQRRYLLFLPLVLAVSFFSGHIQTWFYVFISVWLYGLLKIFLTGNKRNWQNIISWLFSVILTIPLVAIQLLPTWEFYELSGRFWVKNTVTNIGILPSYLITLLAPDFYGNPVTRNDWRGTYAEWSGYAGLVTLILAVTVSSFLRSRKKIWPFLAISVLGLLLSVQSPFLTFISSLPIPILSNSNPTRAIAIFSFGLSMLAGFGAEEIMNNWVKAKNRLLGVLIVVSMIFIILIIITIWGKGFFPVAIANSLLLISLRNLIFPSAVLLSFWAFLIITWIKPSWKMFTVYFLLFTVSLEMLRFYVKWTPFDDKNSFYGQTTIVNFLQKQPGYYRFYGQFTQSAGYLNQLLATDGYEPINLLSYNELLSGSLKTEKSDYSRDAKLQSQEKYTKRLLAILGVKYLLYSANDIFSPFVFPFWKYGEQNYPQFFTDGKYTIFINKQLVQRPQLFSQYIVINNKEQALATLLSDSFDYNKVLVLNGSPGVTEKLGSGSAVIKEYGANKIEMAVQADKPSLLFLSDNYYPGWQATVNGQKTRILLADFTFRAVAVPAGKSLVTMNYQPESFKWGAMISGATLIFLLIFLLLSFPRKRESIK